jgi:predicted nucleic acid-binding protein
MIALVDTSIWSLALRRDRAPVSRESRELGELIQEGRAGIIGQVRQELLSGVKTSKQFELLRDHLRAFRDIELATDDFELAADYFNRCRARGVQGSNTDFLICVAAIRRRCSVFTTDADFASFQSVIPIILHVARG